MANKKMDEFTKFKLTYCIELLVFAVLFVVLGVLFLCKIVPIKPWKFWVFPILTFFGGIWFMIDLVWTIKSKKRRRKNSLIDKILPAPMAFAIFCFDIYALIMAFSGKATTDNTEYLNLFTTVVAIALLYYGAVYLFEGIYHWFVPSKALTSAYEDAERKIKEEEAKELAQKEENKTEK